MFMSICPLSTAFAIAFVLFAIINEVVCFISDAIKVLKKHKMATR